MATQYPGTYEWGDQCLLNVVLADRWGELPPQWNQQAAIYYFDSADEMGIEEGLFKTARHSPSLIHFTGPKKPWNLWCPHPLAEEYRYYRSRTRFLPLPRRSVNPFYRLMCAVRLVVFNVLVLYGRQKQLHREGLSSKSAWFVAVGYLVRALTHWRCYELVRS